jgi:uncharacterized protein (TIGR02145 family)
LNVLILCTTMVVIHFFCSCELTDIKPIGMKKDPYLVCMAMLFFTVNFLFSCSKDMHPASTSVYPPGTIHCQGDSTEIKEVINPSTGKTWMDRNLGASRVAISSTDSLAYGDLYQWGRGNDGHQCRDSPSRSTLSSSDQPNHGDFIIVPNSPYDWRSPQNTNLWQGVNGVNNPCPKGYRIPTEAELNAERMSWNSNNAAGAFASPLKLPMTGYRNYRNGSFLYVGTYGFYWSSMVSNSSSRYLYFSSSNDHITAFYRAFGLSVRCIMD